MESAKSLLFTHVGQNGIVIWRERVVQREQPGILCELLVGDFKEYE